MTRSEMELQTLNAFVDGELDVLASREIEQRMQQDDGLRAQVQWLRQVRESVREGADYHAAPEALRRRAAAMAVVPVTTAPVAALAPARAGGGQWQRWLNWRPVAVSLSGAGLALTLAVLLLNPMGWPLGANDRLRQDVLASHVRATLGEHLVDIASSDHHTVKPWLSSKLDFSPPVPQAPFPGSVFLGGRIDYVDGRPVAALVYRQGGHIVNSFVWPKTVANSAADSAPHFVAERGFQIAHWAQAGMNHWVISDVNSEEFATIVRGIALADERR
jgi:anti-sigma factor RsiW